MRSFVLLTLFVLLSGCGSNGAVTAGWNAPLPETLDVSLHGSPAPGIRELILETSRVEARRSGSDSWFDIHQGGVQTDLIEPYLVWIASCRPPSLPPAGDYNALRIQFGPGSRIATTDGSYAGPLALPPALANGLLVPVDFSIGNGQWTSINLLFDPLLSLQAQPAGSASPYLFRPTFKAFNGHGANQNGLVWKGNASTPLPSAMVTAQLLHAPDPPEILEGGLTFTSPTQPQWGLFYLPLGQPICLVATSAGQDVCVPKAATVSLVQNINSLVEFTLATVPLAGSVQGRVTPVPGPAQADLILVLQELEVAPGRTEQLIVARVLPTLAAEETFTVPSLAPGSYRLCLLRRSFGASGAEQSRSHAWSPSFLVAAGQITSQELAF